ncbi:MAG: T9SS type A sorting domain-containing protein [Bacteroidales bacterium]|nr:T9SS type A sorting domain-containing protein [Bacteroidales bacterium]
MKKTIMMLALLATTLAGSAQTGRFFTQANADGVPVRYQIMSESDAEVRVSYNSAASFTGRIVVPATVEYNDTTWTVMALANGAFSKVGITYVQLPASIREADYNSLKSSTIDTIECLGAMPFVMPDGSTVYDLIYDPDHTSMVWMVPCGSLSAWRWSYVCSALRSPCASKPMYVMHDDAILLARDYYYEVGNPVTPLFDISGWGMKALPDRTVPFIFSGHDTVNVYALSTSNTQATLAANGISTAVFPYSFMSYNGTAATYMVGGNSTIFAASIWIGEDQDQEVIDPDGTVRTSSTRVAADMFLSKGSDYVPGPMRTDTVCTPLYDVASAYNRVWHLKREQIDYHIAHCGDAGYTPIEAIATWPAHGQEGYADRLAPFYDADGDGRYNPMAGDYPVIRGDEAVYSIFNDWYNHNNTGGDWLGFEVHSMHYAFSDTADTALWNTVFVHYDIINRSPYTYNDIYLGAFTDFDIGNSDNDYIGCDVRRNMYYGYNGTEDDGPGGFSGVPPAQGCIMLRGMAGFTSFFNDNSYIGIPDKPEHYNAYLRGRWKNGHHITFGNFGTDHSVETNYMYSGDTDPDHPGSNWTQRSAGSAPGDQRGVGTAGSFVAAPGDTLYLDLAYTTAFDTDSVWGSVERLRLLADDVQRQFDRDTTDSGKPFVYMPYSEARDVAVNPVDALRLVVYPNPASSSVTVLLPQVADITLYDLMGRRLHSLQGREGENTIDLNGLPSGLYLLRAAGAVQRIVKR